MQFRNQIQPRQITEKKKSEKFFNRFELYLDCDAPCTIDTFIVFRLLAGSSACTARVNGTPSTHFFLYLFANIFMHFPLLLYSAQLFYQVTMQSSEQGDSKQGREGERRRKTKLLPPVEMQNF